MRVPKEEADLVGDLRYCWRKLRKQAGEVAESLAMLQVGCCVQALGGCVAAVAAAVEPFLWETLWGEPVGGAWRMKSRSRAAPCCCCCCCCLC